MSNKKMLIIIMEVSFSIWTSTDKLNLKTNIMNPFKNT